VAEPYDPFDIVDPDGVLHTLDTLGLIEDDTDWTDCGLEICPAQGWTSEIDVVGLCEECLRLLWHWESLTPTDLEEIAESSGIPVDRIIDAHNGGPRPEVGTSGAS